LSDKAAGVMMDTNNEQMNEEEDEEEEEEEDEDEEENNFNAYLQEYVNHYEQRQQHSGNLSAAQRSIQHNQQQQHVI
jgi:hypothetical protein